jgi:hypothetical protein
MRSWQCASRGLLTDRRTGIIGFFRRLILLSLPYDTLSSL